MPVRSTGSKPMKDLSPVAMISSIGGLGSLYRETPSLLVAVAAENEALLNTVTFSEVAGGNPFAPLSVYEARRITAPWSGTPLGILTVYVPLTGNVLATGL